VGTNLVRKLEYNGSEKMNIDEIIRYVEQDCEKGFTRLPTIPMRKWLKKNRYVLQVELSTGKVAAVR